MAATISKFGGLSVKVRGELVRLISRQGTYSVYHPTRMFTGFSWDCLSLAGWFLPQPPRRILLLGMGGGTVVRQCRFLYPQTEIHALEIDPQVVHLARRRFHLPRLRVRVVVGDAEEFVLNCKEQYDLVLDDVWRDDTEFVKSLFGNPRYAPALDRCVARVGLYALNLWRHPPYKSEAPAAARVLHKYFETIVALSPPYGPTGVVAAARGIFLGHRTRGRMLLDHSIRAERVRLTRP